MQHTPSLLEVREETSPTATERQRALGHVPYVRNAWIRIPFGFVLLILSGLFAIKITEHGHTAVVLPTLFFAWLLSVVFTDKYVHKYPQRYVTYLIASHGKAAIVMAFFLAATGLFTASHGAPPLVLAAAWLAFVFTDGLVSLLRRKVDLQVDNEWRRRVPATANGNQESAASGVRETRSAPPRTAEILQRLEEQTSAALFSFLKEVLASLQISVGDSVVVDDVRSSGFTPPSQPPVDLLVARTRLNDVRRLQRFLICCHDRLNMGGYLVGSYTPLENVLVDLRRRHSGLRYRIAWLVHFAWYRALPKIPYVEKAYFWRQFRWVDNAVLKVTKRRNRALSKAEMWGRLSYFGIHVIEESKGDGEVFFIGQRALPRSNRTPSFFPVVALEKVGLNGQMIRCHKLRTMFPFSEFLQKRMYDEHGLAASGKFNNDFRLTEVGVFLRRYWLDELPQLFDWLRGDVKLFGIRATSAHFLSLYPEDFLTMYLNTKPGLVPPLFTDSTNGFAEIVEVEQLYLERYKKQPFRTDVQYLLQTLSDIFLRGTRSR